MTMLSQSLLSLALMLLLDLLTLESVLVTEIRRALSCTHCKF